MNLSIIALRPNVVSPNKILLPESQVNGSSFSGRVWRAYSSSMDDASSFLKSVLRLTSISAFGQNFSHLLRKGYLILEGLQNKLRIL